MFILLQLSFALLLIALIVRYYRKNWSRNLSVRLDFGSPAYYEGENGSLIETVTNKKFLPFWWGNIQYHIPSFITVDTGDTLIKNDYKDTLSAFSYEMVKKSVNFTALSRGYYRITTAELLTQDLFFRYRFIRRYDVSAELYVYPLLRHVEDFSIDLKRITGEVIARRHYIEDQFQLRGIRDYYPFDSLKNISWGATAKTGEIKVNQYDYTTSQEVYIMLDFDHFINWDRQEIKEELIRIAGYLLTELNKSGTPVGLITNAPDIENGAEIGLPCKNGANQREAFFRLLSRINTEKTTRPFQELLEEKLHKIGSDPQCILLSLDAGAPLAEKIDELRAARQSLQWILLKDKGAKLALDNRHGLYVFEVS